MKTNTIQVIEKKWQETWERVGLYMADITSAKKPFYNLMMFPYPSAEGLHVGNMYAFTGSDIYGRFKRAQGYDVFEPIGLDGFGIHSENYCIKIGRHPMEHARITEKNFYAQLRKIGAMYDWSKTVETYKPKYYKHTQWLFIQLFKRGLAYRANAEVNWCPSCKTVLADEQVIDGACERCGGFIEKKALTQWFFRITAYADRLDAHLSSLYWSDKVKIAQKNWIGKKEGIDIVYDVVTEEGEKVGFITCFTTRPETNFGATFIAIAPNHEFITQIIRVIKNKKIVSAIKKYISGVKDSSIYETLINRIKMKKEKTGVFTCLYGINPLSGRKMPVYVSDFVLSGVGTGAVVGVPGHDRRDFEFAQVFELPVIRVVSDGVNRDDILTKDDVYEDAGIMMNSSFLDGMTTDAAKIRIINYLESQGFGKKRVVYHLRDWLISRQRYWGPPIPMIYCRSCAEKGKSYFTSKKSYKDEIFFKDFDILASSMKGWYPVEDSDLPVELPYLEDFQPGNDGVPPLKKHASFYQTICPECQSEAIRETEVSDTFLDSAWYFLRYPSVGSSREHEVAFDPEITQRWFPVSMYTGGAEHSVLHLMYSRFITMALHDMGYLSVDEPFANFFAHGLVIKDGAKMSKSKGNVVNPDEYITLYGSDALRLYLMFMGPYSEGGDFRDSAMEGMSRWVQRVWNITIRVKENNYSVTDNQILRALHRLVKKVGEDIERRRYNTAIAAMMDFVNILTNRELKISIQDMCVFLQLLAPFAPHMTEELYQRLQDRDMIMDSSQSIHAQQWPTYREELLVDSLISIVIQVNGKVRDSITVSPENGNNQAIVEEQAKRREKVLRYLKDASVRKIVFVPRKLINFVL